MEGQPPTRCQVVAVKLLLWEHRWRARRRWILQQRESKTSVRHLVRSAFCCMIGTEGKWGKLGLPIQFPWEVEAYHAKCSELILYPYTSELGIGVAHPVSPMHRGRMYGLHSHFSTRVPSSSFTTSSR
jgi:hypothetical protein